MALSVAPRPGISWRSPAPISNRASSTRRLPAMPMSRRTAAADLRLDFKDKGKLTGRVLSEALVGGAMPEVKSGALVSEPAANGLRTVLDMQTVGNTRYFDAGGFVGRTLGLSEGAARRGR